MVTRNWHDGEFIQLPREEPLPFVTQEKLGSDSKERMHRVRHYQTQYEYVMREVAPLHLAQEPHPNMKMMPQISHRHIMSIHKMFWRGDQHYILLGPNIQGSVGDMLSTHQRFPMIDATYVARFFGCLSVTVKAIHERDLCKAIDIADVMYNGSRKEAMIMVTHVGIPKCQARYADSSLGEKEKISAAGVVSRGNGARDEQKEDILT